MPPLLSKRNNRAILHRITQTSLSQFPGDIVRGILLRPIYLSYCPTKRMGQTSPAPIKRKPEDGARLDPARVGRAAPVCRGTEEQRNDIRPDDNPPVPLNSLNGTGRYAETMESGGRNRCHGDAARPKTRVKRSVSSPAYLEQWIKDTDDRFNH